MRRKLMDTLYARIKENIVLDIEKYSYAFYAKIDFRKADSFGLCLKKHIYLYSILHNLVVTIR